MTLLAVLDDAQRGHGRVLLPARRRLHVHAQAAEGDAAEVSVGTVTRVGLIVAAAAVIVIGLVPPVTGAILDWTEAAAQGLVALIDF